MSSGYLVDNLDIQKETFLLPILRATNHSKEDICNTYIHVISDISFMTTKIMLSAWQLIGGKANPSIIIVE